MIPKKVVDSVTPERPFGVFQGAFDRAGFNGTLPSEGSEIVTAIAAAWPAFDRINTLALMAMDLLHRECQSAERDRLMGILSEIENQSNDGREAFENTGLSF